MNNTDLKRRSFLASSAGIGIAALAGCSTSKEYGKGHPIPDGPVANVEIPQNPDEFDYATMGSADADVTIYYFGNYKCPYCAQFSTQVLPDIVTDYISTGDVQLRFRGLVYVNGQPFLGSDAPRIAQGGLAVWNYAPDKYWQFHEYLFKHHPPETARWGTVSNIMNFIKGSGVENNLDSIKNAIQNQKYTELLKQTSSTASGIGISGTPYLYIDGQVINGLNKQEVYNAIDNALQN